jgi:hypothetical protein
MDTEELLTQREPFDFFKVEYPHIYEYHRLGHSETLEGRVYMEKYQKQIWDEHSMCIDNNRYRKYKLGGNLGIHKLD